MNQPIQNTFRPVPKTVPGFNVGQALARMLDNSGLWWQSLAIFYTHYAHWEAAWQRAQAAPESERKCVHALRSSAANVGADQLAAATAKLEQALLHQASSPPDLAPLRAQVLACFLQARQSAQVALDWTDGSVGR